MAPISVPVASRLPSSLRIAPTNAVVTRVMTRLARPSLLTLALDWLDVGNQSLTAPYLRRRRGDENADDDDDADDADFYPPAASLEALQEHYTELQVRKGSKREVLDRMLEGDWRHGLSMYQLAMADLQYLYDHPTSQRWTAFQIVPLKVQRSGRDGDDDEASASALVDKESLVVPRFHPSSFLRNLQAQILPDIKVHYNFDRHKHLPLLLLRIFILDSPYNTSLAAAPPLPTPATANSTANSTATTAVESSRTVYIAFPDASPFVYLSSTQTNPAGDQHRAPGSGQDASSVAPAGSRGEARSLRSLVVEAIPKALSRPRERYALKPTNLATRNLAGLLQRRGAGRTNTAGGGWSIYADEKTIESPLSTVPPSGDENKENNAAREIEKHGNQTLKRPASPGAEREEQLAKRRRQVAAARFGLSAKMDDGFGVERVDIVMQDPFPGGRQFDNLEDEDDEDVDGEPAGGADRRKSRASGRRSQIHAALAHEEEELEDEEREGAPADDTASAWRPRIALTFHGPHVFAGLRQLVEAGIVDGEKMPGWLTGEGGVTVGVVRHGRIRGHKGSGM